MNDVVRPARPHHKLTEDGRRMREVLTYSRRGSRFTPAAGGVVGRPPRRLGDPRRGRRPARLRARGVVRPRGAADRRDRARASARRPRCWPPRAPTYDVLALEVWRPGRRRRPVAGSPRRVPTTCGSARSTRSGPWSTWSSPASLAELWTFFPDPWPKTRHHKRRLVNPAFAALAASRLAPGGAWRLATDWADYADQMREVLDAEPALDGRRRRAVGRAAGDQVRAQGPATSAATSPTSATAGPTGADRAPGPPRAAGARAAAARPRGRCPSRRSVSRSGTPSARARVAQQVVVRRRGPASAGHRRPGRRCEHQRPDAAQGGRELLDRRDRRLGRGRGEVRAHAPEDERDQAGHPPTVGRPRGRRKGLARAAPVGRPARARSVGWRLPGTSGAGHVLHRHCDLAWACGVCQDGPVAPAGRRGAAHLDF